MNPPDSHRDLLERPIVGDLATIGGDGAPRINPMWFLWDAGSAVLKFTHTKERHNYRFLQRDPRIAFSIIDPDDPYRYLQVRGVVEQVEDDPTGAFYQTLQQRYRGYTREVKDRAVRVILTVRPTGYKVRPTA